MSSSAVLRQLLALLEAEEAAKGSNNGTQNSFNNHGDGNQDFSNAKINSGAYSGDRNRYRTTNNHGRRTINNSGTFNGHGNGGFIDGDFDASTTNHNY
ncbi:uncharacterized protein LOC133290712 [Gastrolobium bilobum]|uniref:uncharacterized protein LOC133290712 n=1 Tax=Gastrolobium bilobum TaxID=150636 RepID=UPI002AB0F014|nr:uncharacterized protein LOC133290712 [Gastrolobium bilobum]